MGKKFWKKNKSESTYSIFTSLTTFLEVFMFEEKKKVWKFLVNILLNPQTNKKKHFENAFINYEGRKILIKNSLIKIDSYLLLQKLVRKWRYSIIYWVLMLVPKNCSLVST